MAITIKQDAEENFRAAVKLQLVRLYYRVIFFQGLLAIPDFISGIHKSEVVLEDCSLKSSRVCNTIIIDCEKLKSTAL